MSEMGHSRRRVSGIPALPDCDLASDRVDRQGGGEQAAAPSGPDLFAPSRRAATFSLPKRGDEKASEVRGSFTPSHQRTHTLLPTPLVGILRGKIGPGGTMLPLYEKSTRYLVRGEYRIHDAAPGFAIAEYAGEDLRDRPQRILLWVGDEALPASRALDAAARQERSEREDHVLREMIAEMQAAQDAVGFFVVPSRQGLSADFISTATDTLQRGGRDKRGGIRTPSEFFDTDYKMDTRTGRAAKASALGRLFDRVRSRQRIAQPFMVRTGLRPR